MSADTNPAEAAAPRSVARQYSVPWSRSSDSAEIAGRCGVGVRAARTVGSDKGVMAEDTTLITDPTNLGSGLWMRPRRRESQVRHASGWFSRIARAMSMAWGDCIHR